MPTIEELPDDSPSSPSSPSPTASTSSTTPALPPDLLDFRLQSTESILSSLSTLPIFMSPHDASSTSLDANPSLAALTALAHEGTPLEIATNFRTQGNEAFRSKRFRDAVQFYTRALETPNLPTPPKDKDTKAGGAGVQELCLVNRAAANLELQNYGSVVRDCAKALEINPNNVKAYYRAGLALEKVKRWDEAVEIVSRGVKVHSSNDPLLGLLTRVSASKRQADEKRDKERRDEDARRQKEAEIQRALKRRRVVVKKSGEKQPDLEGEQIDLVEVDVGGGGKETLLVFPVVVLYPLAAQSDFVKGWREDETSEERLGGEVLADPGPPWDEGNREYKWKGVEVYMEAIGGGLIKVGKKVPLGDVLGGGKVEVVDGLVRLMVVARAERDAWIGEWKRRKGK